MKIFITLNIFTFLILCTLTGCMGSRHYKPQSEHESAMYNKASRQVFPEDVKKSPEKYQQQWVAWTGVVKKINKTQNTKKNIPIYNMEIEHHYWDWIEDFGTQKEVILLSPHGEGPFTVERALKYPPKVNDFVISYGRPVISTGHQLNLEQATLRIFPAAAYTTKAMVYGRPGGPIKVIDTEPNFEVVPPPKKQK